MKIILFFFLSLSIAFAQIPFPGRGGGGGTLLNGNIVWVDAKNGNDSTAVRGVANNPFLSITQAISTAQSGDIIFLRPGIYYETQPCKLPANVSLVGSGMYNTIISNDTLTTVSTPGGALLCPGDNSIISDLSCIVITNHADSAFRIPIGSVVSKNGGFTNAILRNIRAIGETDSLYITRAASVCQLKCYDCLFISSWDATYIDGNAGHTADFYDCEFKSILNTRDGGLTRCVNVGLATVKVIGGAFIAQGHGTVNSGIETFVASGLVDVYSTSFQVTGTGARDASCFAGTGLNLHCCDVHKMTGITSFDGSVLSSTVTTADATVTDIINFNFTTPANATVTLYVMVSAYNSSGPLSGSYLRRATFRNQAGTVTQIGTTDVIGADKEDAGAAAWDCTIDVSTPNIRVRATGAAATSINWRAAARMTMSP